MSAIRVLSPELVNRIAAGECVERPSSVAKELIENALDAGAARIDINILDGGRDLIEVADDGLGMAPEDLPLAVHPHATSKIEIDDDLFNIHTMGFRGEALASIGSVARLSIVSRRGEDELAHEITVDAGRMSGPTPRSAPVGTTVSVRDLFYCVPARRKFLKTSQTESGHITEQVARIALAHPGVALSLKQNRRVVHDLPARSDPRERIRDLYGPELADVLLPISREGTGIRVDGLVAPPRASRASGKWEYIFVNGRYIRDKFVSHAVREAYRSLIDPSRYPAVFLFITIDPGHVDVNVHPTKVEVRWRDSNYVHGQVLAALRDKFLRTNLDHRLRTPTREDQHEHEQRVRQAMVDYFTTARPSGGGGLARPTATPTHAESEQGSAWLPAASVSESARVATEYHERIASPAPLAGDSHIIPSAPRSEPTIGPLRPAIQVHRTYLIVETDEGVMLIDQHALHERILYEELKTRLAGRPLESQRLLLPDVLRVPADRIEALETHADTLARLGIELSVAGPSSVALHAFPVFLERVDRPAFVADLLDRLTERGARPQTDTLLHELLDMMACKAAVKAGDPLTRDEIDALLQRREQAQRSSHCPHGRPATLHLSLAELEKQFKRR
jgi:DNA mismatch repair protein MutL